MRKPRIVDFYCCGGGASQGYHLAGFDVVGVDNEPQPNYPFDFAQRDALEALTDTRFMAQFDAAHGSPPCQDHSETLKLSRGHGTGWLLAATRDKFIAWGRPWVLENVRGSQLPEQEDLFGAHGLTLCGCMFPELRGQLYEDRLFETSFPVTQPRHVKHLWAQTKMGRRPRPGECMQVTGHFSDVAEARRRMQLPWLTRDQLAQAIPPVYTRFVGEQLLAHLAVVAA